MTVPGADPTGLSVGEIHVWTAHLVDGDRATADQLGILCREERARAAQFAFERDRARFIQAHGIVRRILAGYCDTDPATLSFARNRHGKPALARRGTGPNLQFSVSHTGDCCMLALRLDHAIGIDIEKLRELPQAAAIAQSYFTAAESAVLAALQGTAQRDAFFLLWTHKEAAVKALGIDLAAHLGRLEFERDPAGQLRLAGWDGDTSVTQRWSVLRLDAEPGYVAALASEHPIQSLSLRNWNGAGAD
jgi:4'-phosphopantetheinyl transferase